MPAYNFQERFADAIKAGEKRQTIRQRGKRPPPKVGDTLILFTGMRTIHCRKLLQAKCAAVEPISISAAMRMVKMVRLVGWTYIYVPLDADEVEALARADGFDNANEFFRFFQEEHGGTLSGHLIKW